MPDIKQVYVDGTTYDIWNTVIIDYGTASSTVWDTIKTAYNAGKNVLLKVSNNQSATLYYRHFYPLVTYAKFSNTSEIFEFRSIGTLSTIRYTLSKSSNSYSWSNGTVNVAPLDSPTFTGTPQITTTPAEDDNSHKIADTAFVTRAIGNIPEIEVDDELSDTSENPVQNKVIKGALDEETERATTAEQGLFEDVSGLADNLFATNTAQGAIATFPDGADNVPVKSLIAQITPVQAGSGDPAPDNIRPISGWTGAEVNRTGINVWDEQWEVGAYFPGTGEKIADSTRIRSKNKISVKPEESYRISLSSSFSFFPFEYGKNRNFLRQGSTVSGGGVYTAREDVYFITFQLNTAYGTTYNNDISINYPSTDTSYHSGTSNKSVDVDWTSEGTVYGGTLTYIGGGKYSLQATKGYAVYDGSDDESWAEYASGNGFRLLISEMASGEGHDGLANFLPTVNNLISLGIEFGRNDKRIYIAQGKTITGVTDLSSWQTYLGNNNLAIVYPLATLPDPIILDAEDVKTLLGDNNIFVDTGNVSVTYRKDIDEVPTEDSEGLVKSGGVYSAIKDVQEEVDAIPDSVLPGATVGASDNLISDTKINSTSPYLYRPVINGVGNRAYSKLIGATVNCGQMLKNGNFPSDYDYWFLIGCSGSTANNTLTVTVTNAGSANRIEQRNLVGLKGHVYMVLAEINPSKQTTVSIEVDHGNPFTGYIEIDTGVNIFSPILKASSDFTIVRFYFNRQTPLVNNDTVAFKELQLFDLTAMFGADIADYVNTLETGEAGAGIAWLKSYGFFGKYAPYDAGSLISTKAEGKRVTGRNHIDEDTLYASFKTGTNAFSGTASAINLTPFNIPQELVGRELTFSAHIASMGATNVRTRAKVGGTDVNGNSGTAPFWSSVTFTPTSTSDMVQITYGANGSMITVFDSVQLEVGASRNAYEVYVTPKTYDLGSDELRGLFKLDANNNIVADGDIKTPDGQITRKYGIVDLGTLTWAYNSQFAIFTSSGLASLAKKPSTNTPANAICSLFAIVAYKDADVSGELCISTAGNLIARDSAYTDAAAFKTAMSGVYLVYELATPTTEQGTPYIDPSIVYPNGTEEYIDTRTVPVPVGNETEYTEDLKGGLETILDTPSANGTYVLKATVSGGVATLGWVAQ